MQETGWFRKLEMEEGRFYKFGVERELLRILDKCLDRLQSHAQALSGVGFGAVENSLG